MARHGKFQHVDLVALEDVLEDRSVLHERGGMCFIVWMRS